MEVSCQPDATVGPLEVAGKAPPRLSPGFLYLLATPLAAGVATIQEFNILGLNYAGWIWFALLLAGVLLLLAEKGLPGGNPITFPLGPWLVWVGLLWTSLTWCERLVPHNIQDALQLSMPVLVGVVASLVVRSEDQLERLLRVFTPTLVLLSLAPVANRLGLVNALGLETTDRVLSLTAALVGCVFMARFPERLAGPLVGWGACILVTALTGSRMATLALLLIPILHPLYRQHLWRVGGVLTLAGLGVVLFYTPIFQERFFDGGGTLEDVANGDFLSFGRFETWPDILDEAWRHPWLGAGVGSITTFVPTVWDDVVHPHNDYLRVGFDVGLVGLSVFLGVLGWQLWDIQVRIRQSRGVVRSAFAAAWLGLLLFMISSFTDNTLIYNLSYMDPLFAVLGAAYGVAGAVGTESAGEKEVAER
jgi:O-antigen ligase